MSCVTLNPKPYTHTRALWRPHVIHTAPNASTFTRRLARTQAAAAKTKTHGRLNAFELLNSALDISAIFEHKDDVVTRRTRFTSKASTHDLLAALQQSTKAKGGSVHVQGSNTSWCGCIQGV